MRNRADVNELLLKGYMAEAVSDPDEDHVIYVLNYKLVGMNKYNIEGSKLVKHHVKKTNNNLDVLCMRDRKSVV